MKEMLFSTDFWYMASALSTVTVFIAGAINGKFNLGGFWAQIIAWVVGSLLGVGAWFLNIVTIGEPTWLGVVCLCVVVGLSSNGIYDIPFMQSIIEKLFHEKKA